MPTKKAKKAPANRKSTPATRSGGKFTGDAPAKTRKASDLLGEDVTERAPRVPFVGHGPHKFSELIQDQKTAERVGTLLIQAKQSHALVFVTGNCWNLICPIEDIGIVTEILEKVGL